MPSGKISKSYLLTPTPPYGHIKPVQCEQPLDQLQVQVWLLYHHSNLKIMHFVSGTELRTNRQTIWFLDTPQKTFQAGEKLWFHLKSLATRNPCEKYQNALWTVLTVLACHTEEETKWPLSDALCHWCHTIYGLSHRQFPVLVMGGTSAEVRLLSPLNSIGGIDIVMRPFVCALWERYRLQVLHWHFQTLHVSFWWWQEEPYLFWDTRSKVKVNFGPM